MMEDAEKMERELWRERNAQQNGGDVSPDFVIG
jgi:hypothetical protein